MPEAQFPVRLNEAYDATRWVTDHGAEIGVDGSRLASRATASATTWPPLSPSTAECSQC